MPETYEVPLIFGGCFPHPSAFWGHETNSKFEAQMGENTYMEMSQSKDPF